MKRFEVGARVVEPTYGLGSVVAVEDAYTRVQFDEHGNYIPPDESGKKPNSGSKSGWVN